MPATLDDAVAAMSTDGRLVARDSYKVLQRFGADAVWNRYGCANLASRKEKMLVIEAYGNGKDPRFHEQVLDLSRNEEDELVRSVALSAIDPYGLRNANRSGGYDSDKRQ